MLYTKEYRSPLGTVLLASDGEALCGLWFLGQRHFPEALISDSRRDDGLCALNEAALWLDRYFSGKKPSPTDILLRPVGTVFRQRVWDRLCRIPYGQTVTYGEIARELAAEDGRACMSAQAVGNAVGRNPISIIIPCHRVLGSGGALTGYAGGLDRKLSLLRLEGAEL